MKAGRKKSNSFSLSNNTQLAGYITPVSWDANQRIRSISLITPDQEEISIIPNEKSSRLLSLVWEKVEVLGKVSVDRKGKRKIKVSHYKTAEQDVLDGDAETPEADENDSDLKEIFGGGTWSSDQDLITGL